MQRGGIAFMPSARLTAAVTLTYNCCKAHADPIHIAYKPRCHGEQCIFATCEYINASCVCIYGACECINETCECINETCEYTLHTVICRFASDHAGVCNRCRTLLMRAVCTAFGAARCILLTAESFIAPDLHYICRQIVP